MEQLNINSSSSSSDVSINGDHQTGAIVDSHPNLHDTTENICNGNEMNGNGMNGNELNENGMNVIRTNENGVRAGDNASENGKTKSSGNMCNEIESSQLQPSTNGNTSSEHGNIAEDQVERTTEGGTLENKEVEPTGEHESHPSENGGQSDVAGPSNTTMTPATNGPTVAPDVKAEKKETEKELKALRAKYMFSEFTFRVRKTAAPTEDQRSSIVSKATKNGTTAERKKAATIINSNVPMTTTATASSSMSSALAKRSNASTSGASSRKKSTATINANVPSTSTTAGSSIPVVTIVPAMTRRDRRLAPISRRRNVAPPRPENAPPQIAPLPQFSGKEEFLAALAKHRKIGSQKFVHVFEAGEHLFKNEDVMVKIWEDGQDFERKIGEFDSVHLFKNKDGLELNYPEKLRLGNVRSFIPGATKLSVIDSFNQTSADMDMNNLINAFKIEASKRTSAFNLLSFEARDSKLKKRITVPKFVRSSSIVDELTKQLEKKKEELKNSRNTKENREKLKEIGEKIWSMPQYQKFVLLSMKDSFTDIHIDFSATSVYYHVVEGRKIFYVARPTAENMEVYKKYETDGIVPKEWIGKRLFSEFQRVEIKKGETAMIPSGYLHFVYTPEDSLVIGGNFLMDKYLKWHFELTNIEEESLKLERVHLNQLYQGFHNVMWAYAEELLEKLEAGNPSRETIQLAVTIKDLLNPERRPVDPKEAKDWFTEGQKKLIVEKLQRATAQPAQGNVTAVQTAAPVQQATTKKRRAQTTSSRKPPAKRRR